MKKYIVVALVVIVGGVLLLVPLLKEEPEEVEIRTAPVVFAQKGNLVTVAEQKTTLKFNVEADDVTKAEFVVDGKVLQTWENPKGTLEYSFTPTQVKSSIIEIRSFTKDGESFRKEIGLRVLSDIQPENLKVEIVQPYPHNTNHYTQGLEFYKGALIEGTGQYGSSKIAEIEMSSGNPTQRYIELDGTYFGEGITILDDVLYQLTWRKGKCFTYEVTGDSFIPKGDYVFRGQEGWGLCNDGENLIMSDGTERLTFRDPETFQPTRTVEVFNDRGPMVNLNELEYINGKVYANVYQTNLIVVIDPETGKILQQIDCSLLEPEGRGSGDVLNGIAYNPETQKIYLTGKNWNKLFEVRFN